MHINKYFTALLLLQELTLVKSMRHEDVEHAFDTLQTWYDPSTGLWLPSTGWWNSANCLTTLANFAAINPKIKDRIKNLWDQSFHNARKFNSEMTAEHGAGWALASNTNTQKSPHRIVNRRVSDVGFLNNFYDDEGWWALAWIQVYDLTGNLKYLNEAVTIFHDMHSSYGQTPVGGMWWDKPRSYVNAIANELYFSVAAHLSNRISNQGVFYAAIAVQAWEWIYTSGLLDPENNIKDGLLVGSKPGNTDLVWSYNQGVVLSALTELAAATKDEHYIQTAHHIADAGLANLTSWKARTPNMILHDPCEGWGDCGRDGVSFKGVFARNLAHLHSVSPRSQYANFLKRNAESVWCNSRDQYNRLGLSWSGPFAMPANAGTQCSGMDVLVGALAQLGEWEDGNVTAKSAADQDIGPAIIPRPITGRASRSRRGFFNLW